MIKRIIALLLDLSVLLCLTIPVIAETRNGVYILDENSNLTKSQYQLLQIQAVELSDALDMDVLYVSIYDSDPKISAQSLNLGKRPNQIMLIDNNRIREVVLFGTAQVLTEEQTHQLIEAYTIEPTYLEGISAYLNAADSMLSEMKAAGAFAQQSEDTADPVFQNEGAELNDGKQKSKASFQIILCLVILPVIGLFGAGYIVWRRRRRPL